jgi:DNA-binding protein H-NS
MAPRLAFAQLWRSHSVSLSATVTTATNLKLTRSHSADGQSQVAPKQAIRVKNQITRVKNMTKQDLKSMSVDELWSLHERVTLALARKITDEKSQLDHRLRQLGLSASGNAKNLSASGSAKKLNHARRPYPQVFPKYRNPAEPAETWAGRGKQPRWLTAQLRSGKKLDDFRIQPASGRARRSAR